MVAANRRSLTVREAGAAVVAGVLLPDSGVRLTVVIPFTFLPVLACVPPTSVVKRSAVVPHAAPIARSGQPMGGNLAEIALGTDTLAPTAAPGENDPDAGLVIPRIQTDIAGRLRAGMLEHVDFGFVYRRAFAEKATPVADDLPNPGRDASIYGASFHISAPTRDPGFRIGFATELSVMDLPFVVFESCIENCAGRPTNTIREDRELVLGYAFTLLPSWRVGRVSFFGGMTMRNHPTIDKKDVVTSFVGDVKGPTTGPPIFILSAGLEVDIAAGLRAGLGVYQPVPGGPVEYAPTVSASLTIPLYREAEPPKQPLAARR